MPDSASAVRMRHFVECANVNGLEPYACLRQVLTDLPNVQSPTDVEALPSIRLDLAA